jgi:hypothetical protein
MSDSTGEAKVSRFVGDAASWSALGMFGAGLLTVLLRIHIEKDSAELIGGSVGVIIALAYTIPHWRRGQPNFEQLQRYLIDTDYLFVIGLVNEYEYYRLRQNYIEYFR